MGDFSNEMNFMKRGARKG